MEMHDGFHDNRLRRCLVNQGCRWIRLQPSLLYAAAVSSHNAASFPPSLGSAAIVVSTTSSSSFRVCLSDSPPAKLPRPYPKVRSRSPNSRSTGVPSGPGRHGAKSGVVEPILLLEYVHGLKRPANAYFASPSQATQKRWESRRAARRSVRVIASQTPPLSLRQATAPSRRPGRSRKRSSRCRT